MKRRCWKLHSKEFVEYAAELAVKAWFECIAVVG